MSEWSRSPLPPGEDERIKSNVKKIKKALEEGPKYNWQLARIALQWDRCIRKLREKVETGGYGLVIECQHIKDGLNLFTLKTKQEPAWVQGGEVKLSNGMRFRFPILVRAPDRKTCRNRAQHGFAKVKLFASLPIDPWTTPEEIEKLLLKMQQQLDDYTAPPPKPKRAKAKQ
jgi:hypothetical protein